MVRDVQVSVVEGVIGEIAGDIGRLALGALSFAVLGWGILIGGAVYYFVRLLREPVNEPQRQRGPASGGCQRPLIDAENLFKKPGPVQLNAAAAFLRDCEAKASK
jgi:hypothetical protein